MNEIKHIHLGSQQFTISVEAYQELRDYLDAIQRQAGVNAKDVIEEVEARMAELLTERGNTPAKVVLAEDVEYLKEQLGEPRDFKDDESTATDEESDRQDELPRRLFRDPSRGMVAGVAAGLGSYLKIDPLIVRLLFIALIFAGGSGILLYIVLWLVVPEARSSSDRLQMRGQPVTLDALKDVVNRADVPGAADRVQRTVGPVIVRALMVVLSLIGIVFVLIGTAMVLASSTATTYGVVHGVQVGNHTIFPEDGQQITILIAGFVLIVLTGIMLAVAGISLIKKRWILPGWGLAAVIVTFIIAASIGSGFGIGNASRIRDSYHQLLTSRTISVGAFDKLNFVGNNTFYNVVPDPTPSVEIRTFGKVDTSAIKVSETNKVLTVDTSNFKPNRGCNILCPYGDTNTEVVIHTPITSLPSSGTPDARVNFYNDPPGDFYGN